MSMHTNQSAASRGPLLVLVHGFLDNRTTWSTLVDALAKSGHACTAMDLKGAGALQASSGPFTLDQAVEDVVSHIGAEEGPVVLVGHSMGAQIAELAAVRLGGAVSALVLLTPTPLEGNTLPDEVRTMLRESGGDAGAQQGIRRAFSRNLSEAQIQSLTAEDVLMGKETVRGYYDAFAGGNVAGNKATACVAPALLLGARDDPVIPRELVRRIHQDRFPDARLVFVDNSGHWLQLEQPEVTARAISDFLRSL